jgi:hypothetical protein
VGAGRGSGGSGGLPPDEYWSLALIGTTWLDRGLAYWLRRVLFWLPVAGTAAMAVAMTVGVVISLTDPGGSLLLVALVIIANLASFVGFLVLAWPTKARAARHHGSREAPGVGGIIGVFAAQFPLAGLVLIPFLLVCASGTLLAVLVLASLPRLPEERLTEFADGALLATRRIRGRQA